MEPAPTPAIAARVVTNETCNQRCAFCTSRRPFETAAIAAAAAVRRRIDEAVRGGARQVMLTGGEPALRRDLPLLVAHARRAGAREVALETNAALITPPRAEALARAGLDLARVHLPRWGDALDAITRDPGGFARTREGLEALAAAGIALEIATPIVRDNLDAVRALPAALAASGLPIRALLVGVPVEAPPEGARALVTLDEAAAAIEAVEEAARPLGLAVRMDPAAPIPPCAFTRPARLAHLYALTRDGASRPDHARIDACGACEARRVCPGVPRAMLARTLDQHGSGLRVRGSLDIRLRPIADDRTRRRLTMMSTVEAQIARELVTRDTRRLSDGTTVPEHIVRINFHCNQVCRFCFVSTHLPAAPEANIEAAIEEIGRAGGVLTLSGGEPTLNPRLAEYVALGKRAGARAVELQTNAVLLAERSRSRALEEAGLDVAFVSLHASNAAISDRITGAPGTFEKTVLGIDALAQTRIALRLNFVFCGQNREDFPALVALVAARWPHARVTVSFVAPSTDLVPLDPEMVPRYADVMPHLAEGVRAAHRLGVELTGFESMCGIPLCLVPDDLSQYFALATLEDGVSQGEFLKTEACAACALEARCYGVRRGYAKLHGVAELSPVAR